MIELKSAGLVFGATGLGLGETNLTFRPGEWTSILGPSGCGKSTLLSLVSGLEKPGAGTVFNPYSKKETGFVFQDSALLPWLTVEENICLPLRLHGFGVTQARERAGEWVSKLRIDHHLDRFPDELSGGLKMRAALARALVSSPRVLLLDEPFSALDEPIRIELGIELRELFNQFKPIVILVTHSITEGLWLSDRTLVMSGQPGKVVFEARVGLPDSRTLAQRGQADFLALVEKCFGILKGAP